MRRRSLLVGAALFVSACGDADVRVPVSGADAPFSPGRPPTASPPPHQVGSFGIEVPAATLAPGEERSPCFLFPLEPTGPSRIVGGGKLTVGPGMHHGNITTRKKTGEGIRPCPKGTDAGIAGEGADILDGGAVLFGSSTQIQGTEWQSFPEGVGYRIKDGYEIVARMHYLNVSTAPLEIAPRYEWYTIDEAALVHEVGPFAWRFAGFEIPPKSELTVAAGCSFPEPMRLVNLMPHAHKLATGFTVGFLGGELDGQLFLDSKGYDPEGGVIRQYDPPIDLSQGDGARFSCTWANTLDKPIVEGIGDNEMCILFGYAWPPESAYSALGVAEDHCLPLAPP